MTLFSCPSKHCWHCVLQRLRIGLELIKKKNTPWSIIMNHELKTYIYPILIFHLAYTHWHVVSIKYKKVLVVTNLSFINFWLRIINTFGVMIWTLENALRCIYKANASIKTYHGIIFTLSPCILDILHQFPHSIYWSIGLRLKITYWTIWNPTELISAP